MKKATAIAGVSNGGKDTIESGLPFIATVTIEGSTDILFHAWNSDSIEAKAKAPRGSDTKKKDDLESYVYRNNEGEVCIPGMYLKGALVAAGRYHSDPRSTRKKMATDLVKSGVDALTGLASTGLKEWDYVDRRRVKIGMSGVTRERPALRTGWKATFDLQVNQPEFISKQMLHELLTAAGRFVGLGDFRPTFGRFQVTGFVVN